MLRILKYLLIAALLSVAAAGGISAEEGAGEIPRVSFGAGLQWGYYDFVTAGGGTVDWEGGTGYGVGILAEYMLGDVFSLQTGFWYGVNFINLTMDGSDTIEARTEDWVIPFYFIVSYTSERFSGGLIAGLSFMHIRKSEFHGGMGTVASVEVTEYLNYDLYGVSGGLQVKIGVARFVDLFFQGLAEIYANKFIISTGGTAEYLYDFRVVTGVMLKTY